MTKSEAQAEIMAKLHRGNQLAINALFLSQPIDYSYIEEIKTLEKSYNTMESYISCGLCNAQVLEHDSNHIKIAFRQWNEFKNGIEVPHPVHNSQYLHLCRKCAEPLVNTQAMKDVEDEKDTE